MEVEKALTRRGLVVSATSTAMLGGAIPDAMAAALPQPRTIRTTNGFPSSVTALWTGSHSHWLQPWRSMMATQSLATIENGLGFNTDPGHPEALPMFAAAGFRHVRMSLMWSQVSYDNPTTISPNANAQTVAFINAAQAVGLRPLVLVQAIDQGPCPYQTVIPTAAAPISPGDTSLTLSSSAGLIQDYSGLTGFYIPGSGASDISFVSTAQVMGNALVTGIERTTVTLSKPVGVSVPVGGELVFNTLLYKPWSQIGTTDYSATMRGWTSFLGTVSSFMQSVLGTAGKSDLGFDIEIWNETSFGSNFLDINNYYATPVVPEEYVDGIPAVIPDIIAQSSAYILAHPTMFTGVRVADGFASVSPMQAASAEPAAITALSKHPYPSPISFPQSDPGYWGLDTTGTITSDIPSYTMYAHEYFSSGISPFTLARDIATTTSWFGGVAHGQWSRTIKGVVAPVPVWMTEIGTSLEGATGTAGDWLCAKGTLRALFFNLGIGVERLYLFAGIDGSGSGLGMVPQNAPTTPTLVVNALEASLGFIRGTVVGDQAGSLSFHGVNATVTGGTPRTLFKGNGTTACPDFAQPDDFVVLPIQVTPLRVAFVFWFTSLDMRSEMGVLPVSLTITGLGAYAAPRVSGLDPIGGTNVGAVLHSQSTSTAVIRANASDRPFIIVLDQTPV